MNNNEVSPTPRETPATPRVGRRLLLLMLCIAAGIVIGFIGQWMTGSSAWFVAVPACVGLAWLFVADPSACLSRAERPDASRRSST